MELIIQDKELAQCITSPDYHNSVYLSTSLEHIVIVGTFRYNNNIRHDLVISNIPTELIDKIKTLLKLGTDKYIAFEVLLPYLKHKIN